jgi:hypothetical protein
MVVGIALGLYAGLWWAFIGGIVQVIDAAKATPVEALGIALGVARVIFAAAIGWISALILIVPGVAMLKA